MSIQRLPQSGKRGRRLSRSWPSPSPSRRYIEAAVKAGLGVDTFAPALSFFLARPQPVFFEEVANSGPRADLGRLMRDRFRAKNPLSLGLPFHTQTTESR